MKITAKVALIILSTTICLSAIFFAVFNSVFSNNYTRIENNLMSQNLERIQYAIANEESTLSKQSQDWSYWDDTYRFVEDGNQDYIQTNMVDQSFISTGTDIMGVINNSGEIVYIKYYDLETQKQEALSDATLRAISDSRLLAYDVGKGNRGIIEVAEGPLLFGDSPILTSKGEGPVHGTFFFGRFLDGDLLDTLSTNTQLLITINQLDISGKNNINSTFPDLSLDNPQSIKPLNSKILAGTILIPDYFGNPVLSASTQTTRDIFSQGKTAILWLLIGLILVATAIILANIFSLDRFVLKRIRGLNDFVSKTSKEENFSARIYLKGSDEIFKLANGINSMLAKLTNVNEQLAENEAKYSTLVESSSDGIVLITNEKITYANTRTLQMSGFSEKELLGSSFIDFVCRDYQTKALNLHTNRMKGKPVEDRYEIEIVHKNGGCIQVELTAKLIKIHGQHSDMVVLRDISETKKAQKELADLYRKEITYRQELEEEVRVRAQFINVMAHELRTPLTPIMVSVEMVQDILSSDRSSIQFRMINNAMEGAETLRTRLDELLDLARFSRGVFNLAPCKIETHEFLNSVVKRFDPVLMIKRQTLVIHIPSDLPTIEADPSRLEQVIINLLSNASKYSPDNTQVSFRASYAEQGILIEIQDQGIGITDEDKRDLFLPYHRVQQDRQCYPGIGLGLAVCKQIIEAHKGSIWIESKIGKGSIFKFTLPIIHKNN